MDREWFAREPHLADHESRVLQMLEGTRVPAPRLIAVDVDGSESGHPSVLMSLLPGEPRLSATDVDGWLREMVSALLEIHAVTLGPALVSWRYFTYNDIPSLTVPKWSMRPEAWRLALERLSDPMPTTEHTLIHRDYHPANLLWVGEALTGVVDWVNSCVGPPGIDIGHCALNLAQLHGVEIADGLRSLYEEMSGTRQDPYFDLITAIEVLPEPRVFPGWRDLGVSGLDDKTVRRRLDEYLTSIVARL